MKKIMKLTFAGIIMVSVLALSCQKENDAEVDLTKNLVGTYKGNLIEGSLKNVSEAITDVTKIGNNLIGIHCYSTILDTTFVMELFENRDSMMVCNTGDDFMEQYGHNRMEEHHIKGSMNWQDWSHHMGEEHSQNDEHFGGFNMIEHSFGYTFLMSDNFTDFTLHFNGKKQ